MENFFYKKKSPFWEWAIVPFLFCIIFIPLIAHYCSKFITEWSLILRTISCNLCNLDYITNSLSRSQFSVFTICSDCNDRLIPINCMNMNAILVQYLTANGKRYAPSEQKQELPLKNTANAATQ